MGLIELDIKKETAGVSYAIEYHADDYGMFPTQSQRILDCHHHGQLNGVSVMTNSPYLAACMEMLRPVQEKIALTVHLNVIEGCSLCRAEEVPLLTDRQGVFRVSFGNLLLRSYLPGRQALKEQLKKEIRAQIDALRPFVAPEEPLRLDSHAHYHMIPVFFDALMEVIETEERTVSYIRIPREYPSLYLRYWKQLRDFSPINLVKVMILNLLAVRNTRKYRTQLAQMEQKLFLGVFLSGSMHRKNVEKILPDAIHLAESRNMGMEILAHPGGVYEEQDIAQLTHSGDLAFLTSDDREKETTLYL